MAHGYGLRRTIGNAVATTGTARGIELGQGDTAQAWRKMDGGTVTAFAAGTADDCLPGQTARTELDLQRPWRNRFGPAQGLGRTDADAFGTKGTDPCHRKYRLGKTTRSRLKQAGRAGLQAITTPRAGFDETRLFLRPRRANGLVATRTSRTQKTTTGNFHQSLGKLN